MSTRPAPPITPYERAVCYYTLPKVVQPLTLGLIWIYALCVIEAIGAFSYGVYANDMDWTTAGAYSFAGIVAFGLVAFFFRAMMNEVRERKALAEARNSPMLTPAEDVPDPFADHVLLRHTAHAKGSLFECASGDDVIHYEVEHHPHTRTWVVRDAGKNELFTVRVLHGIGSFQFTMDRPKLMEVSRAGQSIAKIRRRGGLKASSTEITSETLSPKAILVRNRGIYVNNALRGRIYTMGGYDYLDIHRDTLNDAILGYFVTLT
nr:hypothetical protein [uncultured bacterium]